MSYPTQYRSVLSPKHSNSVSPTRKGTSKASHFNSKKGLQSLHESKLPPNHTLSSDSLGFIIFEDKPNSANEGKPTELESLNFNDQENILKPLKVKDGRSVRSPLNPLDIHVYPGFITYSDLSKRQLLEPYHPANSDNEFRSLHKHLDLLNYVTPPRKHRRKYLVSSKSSIANIRSEEQYPTRRQRSLSVGKNESKHDLISKNNFNIMTN